MQLSKEDTTFVREGITLAREGITFAGEGIEINLNDFIKVKLNDLGKDVYRHSLFGQDPKVDENGYTEFQLWVFMNIYGAYIGMTDPPILETMNVLYGYERLDKSAIEATSSADVVEVVLCKDCKHYYFAENRIPQEQRYVCDLDGDRWNPDSFCSFAERRTDETDRCG